LREDIAQKKPLIIDTGLADKTLYPLSSQRWDNVDGASEVVNLSVENYTEIGRIPNSKWKIWIPNQ